MLGMFHARTAEQGMQNSPRSGRVREEAYRRGTSLCVGRPRIRKDKGARRAGRTSPSCIRPWTNERGDRPLLPRKRGRVPARNDSLEQRFDPRGPPLDAVLSGAPAWRPARALLPQARPDVEHKPARLSLWDGEGGTPRGYRREMVPSLPAFRHRHRVRLTSGCHRPPV